jgi:hypothetical protein
VLEGGGWSAPRPGRFTPGKHPVPIVQEAGWAPGPVWTCAKNLAPTGIRSPDRPARSQSLYQLSYPAHSVPKYKSDFNLPKLDVLKSAIQIFLHAYLCNAQPVLYEFQLKKMYTYAVQWGARFTNAPVHKQFGSRTHFPSKKRLG